MIGLHLLVLVKSLAITYYVVHSSLCEDDCDVRALNDLVHKGLQNKLVVERELQYSWI